MNFTKQFNSLFIAFIMLVLLVIQPQITYAADTSASSGHETSVVSSPTGKKGIIASYWTDPGSKYYDDPIALGVDHALFNIDLTEVVNTNGKGEAFTYNGKTYYYNNYDGTQFYYTLLRMQEVRDKGITLTAQINMQWSEDTKLQELIYPGGREPGHNYYALNTSTVESQEVLSAAFHYLVTKCPYVNNWIVGCEINSPEQCNYCGTIDVNTNVTIAVQTYDLMYKAIQDVNPSAKNYVCLDNIWNFDNGAGIPAKTFLEEFAKRETDKTWHLAFHPYPVPYGSTDNAADWNMWGEKSSANGYLTHTQYTGFLTGANLEVLSNFVKNNYGSEHRIILTEFGFDSRAGEDSQAAALYYTYKAAERDDMIDACIYQPWTDTGWDFRHMGILASDGTQRKIYNVFKYMDSNAELASESYYLNFLNISSWSDNIIYNYKDVAGGPVNISGVYIPADDGTQIRAGAVIETDSTDLTYECTVIDYDYATYGTTPYPAVKTTMNKYDNWMTYVPTHPGVYGFCWRAYRNGVLQSEAGSTYAFGVTVSAPTTNVGWISNGGKWYYYNADGSMATGWLWDGSNWYYMNGDGSMATGWIWDGSNWYYMNSNGAMATGWITNGYSWYYLRSSGAMATGWVWDGYNWYYMNSDGSMATGWIWDGYNWYYMSSSGAMVSNTWIGSYYVNSSGAWSATR